MNSPGPGGGRLTGRDAGPARPRSRPAARRRPRAAPAPARAQPGPLRRFRSDARRAPDRSAGTPDRDDRARATSRISPTPARWAGEGSAMAAASWPMVRHEAIVSSSTAAPVALATTAGSPATSSSTRALDVAVDQADRVGGGQAPPRLHGHRPDRPPLVGAGGRPRVEGLALDVLHGDEQLAVELADLVHRDHRRVLELGQRLRLSLHAGLARLAEVRAQQLQRHAAAQLVIVGDHDHAHAPRADLFEQHVATQPRARGEGMPTVADVGGRGVGDLGQRDLVQSAPRVVLATQAVPSMPLPGRVLKARTGRERWSARAGGQRPGRGLTSGRTW